MIKEYVPLKNWYTSKIDRVFKTVFVGETKKELLEEVLKETLKQSLNIKEFHIAELKVRTTKERVKLLDVLIELENKDFLVLEVNTSFNEETRVRNLNYLESYASQYTERGKKYRFCKFILINYNFTKNNQDILFDHYTWQNERGKKFTKTREIIVVNMDKVIKTYYNKDGKAGEIVHLAMLDMSQEELYELSKKDQLANMYYEELARLNSDAKFVRTITHEEEEKMFQEFKEEGAKRRGIAIGEEKGKKEGKQERNIEIAKKMINENMEINTISRITNLSKEEILNLK